MKIFDSKFYIPRLSVLLTKISSHTKTEMMRLAKARVLVRGNVQGVGYRALLIHTARRLRIMGLTRNLKDSNVEIFCEGTKKNIERFLKGIEAKGDPEDILSLHVEAIECFWEGEEGYQEAWTRYEDFEIDYGVRMSEYQYLAMEDREYGKLYLSNLTREQKDTKNEIHNRFDEMKNRYDKISNQIAVLEDVPKELQLLRKSIDKFLDALLQRKKPKD